MLPKLLLIASASQGIVGILAVSITVLVFSTIGLIPGYAWNIVALLGVMLIYIKNYNDTELFIVYSLFFISILGLLGLFHSTIKNKKEGFYVNNMRLISPNIKAKQCQDACEADRECKYSIMPLNTSEAFPAKENKCWLSYGLSQKKFGNSSSGYDVWRNKKYKEPIVIKRTFDWPNWNVGRGGFFSGTVVQTTPSKPDNITIRYERFAPMYPKNLNFSAVLKDQGWGNSTKGIYIRLEGMNGENIHQVELKAPRSVRNIRKRRCESYRCGSYFKFDFWNGGFWKPRYCPRCYYYSQSVAGPMISESKYVPNLPNKLVSAVRVWAQTRGQGHSLMGSKVAYSLTAYTK